MKHGEIRWYKFVRPDKKRPVLILRSQPYIAQDAKCKLDDDE